MPALIQQLAAGSLDAAQSTGLVDPIRAIDKGGAIAILRIEMQAPPYVLVAKPTIKSWSELKGKTISVGGPKDITRIYVERMSVPNGVKRGDFDKIYAGSSSARFAALKAVRSMRRSCRRRSISMRSRRASTVSA